MTHLSSGYCPKTFPNVCMLRKILSEGSVCVILGPGIELVSELQKSQVLYHFLKENDKHIWSQCQGTAYVNIMTIKDCSGPRNEFWW
uniref:Uncharacterized protein n=1 Tax=Pseudonaja textilis TaxID=8673 RepID=A0A670Y301_PSETE